MPVLAAAPMRGGLPTAVPTDPTVYRFYEALQVYGGALKELIAEQFGDGIMSAINFSVDIQKRPHPSGDRVVVTFDGNSFPINGFRRSGRWNLPHTSRSPSIWCSPAGRQVHRAGGRHRRADGCRVFDQAGVGVSAGSVVAAILAAGSTDGQLTGAQVKELAFSVPLRKWRDAGPVPYLGAAWGWSPIPACTAATWPTTGSAAS